LVAGALFVAIAGDRFDGDEFVADACAKGAAGALVSRSTQLTDEHDALVVELGASDAGEIDYLASLAQPTVAVITNAAAAHLEGFGSVAGIAAAKGGLLDHLPRAGTAVLNAGDPFRGDGLAHAASVRRDVPEAPTC
jgi:UDP-N-acetylmuramyl pentapeptide synthase